MTAITGAAIQSTLKGQKISGWGILGVGVLHTAAHFLIPQPREALFGILQAGVVNTLGPDWAAANFSVLMSLVVGFLLITTGIFVLSAANAGWKIPHLPAIALLLVFLFIVAAGPNGGGWLGLPFCGFLVYQGFRR